MPDPDILKIGKYEVQAELGQGGFGKVYRAFDPTVGRLVAIKILTTDGNRDVLTRFRNEATAAGKLKHKNIVTVHEFGEHNGRPFLVMELLEGQDLLQIIKDQVPLTLLQKMNIMDQVAEGLDCAHGNGVIHRDIKPANIRLLPDGTVKIMDFGVARMSRDRNDTRLTQQGDLIGTILYMSPEQFTGSVADVLSDIFAYGVTYYELLTGKHPFKSTDPARVMFKISMEDPEPLRSLVPECPEGLEQIINRALLKDRELRYQGLRDLRLDTEPLLFELEQDRARALVVQAQKLSDAGEFTGALSIIHEAMDLDPGNRDVRQLREAIQRELQQQAIQSRVKGMLQTAEEQLTRREFAPAIQTLELALKLDQTNLRTRASLEAARASMQQFKEAARLVSAALHDLRNGELSAALEKGSEAARLDPLNGEAERVLSEVRKQISIRDRIQEIDTLRTQGDIDSCVRELRALASLHPDSRELKRALEDAVSFQAQDQRVRAVIAEAEQLIAQSHLGQSHFGDAIDGLATALNEFPKEPRILALLLQAKEGLRARLRAEEIDKAVRTAESLRDAANFDGSLREIDRALVEFPDEARLTELRAAVSTAKAAWERDLFVKSTVEHCNALRANRRLAEAVEVAQAGLKKYEMEPALVSLEREVREQWELEQRTEAVRLSAEEGQRLLDQGRTEPAVEALEKACAQYPEAGELQTLLARAQQRRAAVEQAVREARGCSERQDFERASQILEKALESWPKEGRLEELLQATSVARTAWERERELDQLAQHCEQLRANRRLAEALEVIQAGLKKYRQEPALLRLEAEVREQRERQQRADAVRGSAEAGQRLLDQGQFQQAVESLEQACARYPEEADLGPLLSRAKEELQAQQRRTAVEKAVLEAQDRADRQDFAGALKILEQALKSWPGESRLEELLQATKVALAAKDRAEAIDTVLRECSQLRTTHQLPKALQVIQAGLLKFAEEPALVLLEKEVREQWEREQRAEAVRSATQDGQRLLDEGRFPQAVEVLERACARYPEASDLRTLLNRAKEELQAHQRKTAVEQAVREAQGWAHQREFTRAEQILGIALESWPGESRLVEVSQKITAAKTEWEREQSVNALAAESQRLRANHQLAEALKVIEAGLLKYPQAPSLLRLENEVREEWERHQRAEAVTRSAEEGQRLLDDGRFQQAVQLLEKACVLYREESHLQTLLNRAKEGLGAQQRRAAVEQAAREAQGWTKKHDFKRALQILEKALEVSPGDGRLEELIENTKAARAAREREQAVEAVVRKCNQLRASHRLADALNAVQAGLQKYEDEPALLRLESELREQSERQQRAEAAKRILEEAQRLLNQGQTQLAVAALEKGCGQYPEESELQTALAQARQRWDGVEQAAREAQRWAEQKDFTRALEILDKALLSWPGESRIVDLLRVTSAAKTGWEREQWERQQRAEAARLGAEQGRRLLDEGRVQQAVELLEKVCAQYPEASEPQALLAQAKTELQAQNRREAVEQAAREAQGCVEQQDFKRALQILEKALKSWPAEGRLQELLQTTKAAQAARERAQAIDAVVRECNQLVANRRLAKARKVVQAALRQYQNEPALVQLEQELVAQQDRPQETATPSGMPLPAVLRSQGKWIGIGLGLVVLLAASFFVPRLFRTNRGVALTLTSNIDGAAILVGDKSCVMPDCALTLPTGAYKLTATKDGFKTVSQTVSVPKSGSELKIPLVFEPLPQLVQVNTNFASGRVSLDNGPAEELRDGQFTLSGVSPGNHTLRITAGDAQFETEWRSTIGAFPELQRPINAKNVQATVITNVGQKGTISCDCDVQTIKVDGNAVAAANSGKQGVPLADLKEGARRINIGDRSLVVDIKPNPSVNVFLALDREVGTLVIETGVDGAKVYINGRQYHRLSEHGMVRIPSDVGRYAIRVEKDGFRPASPQTVDLAKSEEKQVAFVLTPVPPVLDIAGALPGAQVKVDGKVVGETGSNGSFRTEVSAGNHVVELAKQDYTDVRFSSEFAPGRTLRPDRSQVNMTRVAKLVPPPAPAPAETKPTDAQDWDRVRASNNPDELEDFIRRHPGSSFTEEARARITQLRAQIDAAAARQAEQAAWNALDRSNKAALQDFVSRYGSGPHAQDARGLIAGIEKQEADAIAAAQRLKEQKPKEPDQALPATADYQSVERTLSAYEAAYNSKDFKALQSAWQAMPKNMADATRREFGDAKAISFQIRPLERATINGDSATINCTRRLSLTTKSGRTEGMAGERVKVTLGRAGSGWLIQSITPY